MANFAYGAPMSRLSCLSILPAVFASVVGCSKSAPSTQSTTSSSSSSPNPVASASAAPVLKTVQFKKSNPAVGASFKRTQVNQLKATSSSPSVVTFAVDAHSSVRVDVLAADEKTILKVKATYSDNATTNTQGSKAVTETSSVAGKAYIIEFVDKKLLITDENHKKVSAAEASTLKDDFEGLVGKPDPLLTHTPDLPLAVGDRALSIAEATRELFGPNADVAIEDTSASLKEIALVDGQRVAIFAIQLKVTTSGNPKIVGHLTGTLGVREADAKLVSYAIDGPVVLTGQGGLKGEGTLAMTEARVY